MDEKNNQLPPSDFIRDIITQDLESGKHQKIITRFPPEPNGFLHIGHAMAICLNFSIASQFKGQCHLRFDDTNPETEETRYVDAIEEDIKWLGFNWGSHLYFTSDYFQKLYDFATHLIKNNLAYVCELTIDEFKEYRGEPTRPGKESPCRHRSTEENLDLFERMKNGEFEDGKYVLRAKIDMSSPNLHLRDPALYRIRKAPHHRTGDSWSIYPMYDFAHALSDALEGITHSLCSLEFEVHRPLYDWCVANVPAPSTPRQIEFARRNLSYTITSKRKLRRVVEEKIVSGWDDPRMPTISGLRRRGYTPESIRTFCSKIGVTKVNGISEIALLEHTIREELNKTASRYLAVLTPLKLIIENYPENQTEELEAINNPGDPQAGTRKLPFSRELYIEREDFMENAPKKFFRLSIGREVRLRYAYYVTCTKITKDPETDEITEIHCTYDPESRGGETPDGRKVKGTIHWVSASHAIPAPVRLYDRLFTREDPEKVDSPEQDFIANLNPNSLTTITAQLEPELAKLPPASRVQFERKGYFITDKKDSSENTPVFNQIVPLRDSWTKKNK